MLGLMQGTGPSSILPPPAHQHILKEIGPSAEGEGGGMEGGNAFWAVSGAFRIRAGE